MSFKYPLIFLCAVVLLYPGQAGAATYTSKPLAGFQFALNYPDDWQLVEMSPKMVAFVSPAGFKTLVSIVIHDVREWGYASLDMESYIKLYDDNLKESIPNYKLEERAEGSFAGYKGYTSICSYADSMNLSLKAMSKLSTFLVNGVYAVDMGFTSTPEDYDTYLNQADNIINSFHLVK